MALEVADLIEAADLNGLLRAVDGMCSARRWDDLLDLADRCEEAVERGKQLWPIATHIDYRIALEAPGEYAAGVLHVDASRFALAPLTEVAASTHGWRELAPHLDDERIAAYFAQERVLRGEDLREEERAHPEVLDLPLVLTEWEPTYALATFGPSYVEVAEPWETQAAPRPVVTAGGELIDDPELTDSLLDLVGPWTSESNGAARAVVVEGDARAACSKLTFGSLRMQEMDVAEASQRMAWAAASGGAHGRRRGAATGRFMAWYTGAVVAGCGWPPEPVKLGELLEGLDWFRWDEGQAEEGWVLRIAVASRREGWAAALAATDILEETSRGSASGSAASSG